LEGPGIIASRCPTCQQPGWKRDLVPNHALKSIVELELVPSQAQQAELPNSRTVQPAAATATTQDSGSAASKRRRAQVSLGLENSSGAPRAIVAARPPSAKVPPVHSIRSPAVRSVLADAPEAAPAPVAPSLRCEDAQVVPCLPGFQADECGYGGDKWAEMVSALIYRTISLLPKSHAAHYCRCIGTGVQLCYVYAPCTSPLTHAAHPPMSAGAVASDTHCRGGPEFVRGNHFTRARPGAVQDAAVRRCGRPRQPRAPLRSAPFNRGPRRRPRPAGRPRRACNDRLEAASPPATCSGSRHPWVYSGAWDGAGVRDPGWTFSSAVGCGHRSHTGGVGPRATH
jgi:hypothetical protein